MYSITKNIVVPDINDAMLFPSLDVNNIMKNTHQLISQKLLECSHAKAFDLLRTLDPATLIEEVKLLSDKQYDNVLYRESVLCVLNVWRRINGLQPYPMQPIHNSSGLVCQRSFERFCVNMQPQWMYEEKITPAV